MEMTRVELNTWMSDVILFGTKLITTRLDIVTEDMIADILTKPLDPKLLNYLQPHLLGYLV